VAATARRHRIGSCRSLETLCRQFAAFWTSRIRKRHNSVTARHQTAARRHCLAPESLQGMERPKATVLRPACCSSAGEWDDAALRVESCLAAAEGLELGARDLVAGVVAGAHERR